MKIQKISQFQKKLQLFSIEENFQRVYERFLQSDLGKIYQAIPWDTLANAINIRSNKKGPCSIFSPQGKLALMFLKNYSCCSDRRLIEQLNSNIDYQIFCDIFLGIDNRITNYKIVSQVRCELSSKLKIEKLQQILSSHWKPFMTSINTVLTDATCYESEVRYPTNQKLLWESVNWNYCQIKLICKYLKIKQPRTKYLDIKDRYFDYSRKRRKSNKQRTVITRSLLKLLEKQNSILDELEKQDTFQMPEIYYKRRSIIKKVHSQQNVLFTTGEKPTQRIVSISKDYLRPIVRGKETKLVEFGAKVNKIQIDGINFIEHISFDAFNEGTRFKSSIYLAQLLMSTRIQLAGADAIYATNKNRKFATSNNIRTDFTRKGKASSEHEQHRIQLARIIKKERASKLEGSFGKEKEHYYLKKIKARTKQNEILWIFFGIHLANAFEIGNRIAKSMQLAA